MDGGSETCWNILKVVLASLLMSFWLYTLTLSQQTSEAKVCVFSISASILSMLCILFQNLYMWFNFGIASHNQFYSIQTNQLKTMALLKVIVSSLLFWTAVRMVVSKQDERSANFSSVAVSIGLFQIVMRHIIFDHFVSWVQIGGILSSLVYIVLAIL
jgi:hypothetical protein